MRKPLPFLAHLSRRLEWAIVIAHRPSVVRPSSVRPSGVNFHIFDFSSETAERNSTKLDRKQDLNALYQVCVFRADRKNKMAALASDWLRHFRLLLWNRWTEFNETWQEARSQSPLPSLCFSGRSEKEDGRPGLWLAETFSTSPLKSLNRIQQNLIGSKISKPSTKFVFLGPIEKTRWPPWPLIGWDIFDFSVETAEQNSTNLDRKQDLNALYLVCVFRADPKKRWPPWPLIGWDIFVFSSETAEPNSMKLDRKQDLNALYQVCVFWADRKNKMAALASYWLRHFRLLSETAERNSAKLDRNQALNAFYHVCVFQANQEKQNGCPGLWLAETFSTSPLKLWKEFDKFDRKQDLNALFQVCVFQVDRKNKMAALAYDLLRHFQLFPWNRWIEFNKTWQEARSQHPLPGLGFSGWSEKQDSHPVLWLAETFLTSPMKPLNGIQRNLTESKFSTSSTKFVFFRLIQKTMAALASDWLRHILTSPLKPLNGIQQNLTGSKILTSSTKFVFFGPKSEYKLPPWPIHQRRWHIVLRCTLWGPLGLLFMNLFRWS